MFLRVVLLNCVLLEKALDILGSTPWRINQFVLKIAQRLWESGGGMLEMPSRTDLVIPAPPEGFLDDPKEVKWEKKRDRRIILTKNHFLLIASKISSTPKTCDSAAARFARPALCSHLSARRGCRVSRGIERREDPPV